MNNKIESLLVKTLCRLPRKIFYPRKYCDIYKLLRAREIGQDISEVIKRQLASLLRLCLTTVPHYIDLNLAIDIEDITQDNAYEILKLFPYLTKNEVMEVSERFVSN